MKIYLDTGDGRQIVRAYRPGVVQIGDQSYERSLILTPERIIPNWRPRDFGELEPALLLELAALKPEVVLLGTGERLRFPPTSWLTPFFTARVGIECMDTGAACRTYNLLLGEGRHVVAGLLLAEPSR